MSYWETEIPLLIRYTIGDVTSPQSYTDDRLKQQAVAAAIFVQTEVDLTTAYSVSIASTGIVPDPCDPATRDDLFVSLVTMKSACMLATNEFRIRGGQAISIKDGDSSISTSDRAKTSKDVAANFCEMYSELKWDIETGQSTNAVSRFRAVTSPFRFQYGGNPPPSY